MFDAATTATIQTPVCENKSGSPADLVSPGRCTAAAQLFASMDAQRVFLDSITSSEANLLCPFVMPASGANSGAYAVMEFTVNPPIGCNLRVRTVMTSDPAVTGNWNDTPYQNGVISDTHIRGWWPYSRIRMAAKSTITLDAGGAAQEMSLSMADNSGPE
jgi:hypothetical protein